MSQLHFAWVELSILTPLVGALAVSRLTNRERARRVCIGVCLLSVLLAGGGVKGGSVLGSTTSDGTGVKDRPVSVADLFCSFCHTLKIDPRKENLSTEGRPLKIVDGGKTVKELF